jgi:hypothetical protein
MGQPVIKGARVECERCGVVRVPLRDLVLRVGMHDGRAEVRFRCDMCGQLCLQTIDDDHATTLARTDIVLEWWEPSPELEEHHNGAALTEADVDAWVDLLADDDALWATIDVPNEADR